MRLRHQMISTTIADMTTGMKKPRMMRRYSATKSWCWSLGGEGVIVGLGRIVELECIVELSTEDMRFSSVEVVLTGGFGAIL